MKRRYKTLSACNPLPYKTAWPNSVPFSSVEEQIAYLTHKRQNRTRKGGASR